MNVNRNAGTDNVFEGLTRTTRVGASEKGEKQERKKENKTLKELFTHITRLASPESCNRRHVFVMIRRPTRRRIG